MNKVPLKSVVWHMWVVVADTHTHTQNTVKYNNNNYKLVPVLGNYIEEKLRGEEEIGW